MTKILDSAATVVLVSCAVVIAGVTLRRELAPKPQTSSRAALDGTPTFIDDWQRFAAIGKWVGDSTAKVKIVEFADFECPYCKRFHDSFHAANDSLGTDVALLLLQYPLGMHKFARPAAYAAECADKMGRWQAFQSLLFERQDSLGLKS